MSRSYSSTVFPLRGRHISTRFIPSGCPCLLASHGDRRGWPCPAQGSGHSHSQLPWWLTYPRSFARIGLHSQGHGPRSPSPIGTSGQLGKDETLPCAEYLFSWYKIVLSQCWNSWGLSVTKQWSLLNTEAPGAYGVLSCGHAAGTDTYETASYQSPEMDMALGTHRVNITPQCCRTFQPLEGHLISTGRSALSRQVPLQGEWKLHPQMVQLI